MEPPRLPHPPSQPDVPDIATVIEAMAAALTQQGNAIIQQHKASMQRQVLCSVELDLKVYFLLWYQRSRTWESYF